VDSPDRLETLLYRALVPRQGPGSLHVSSIPEGRRIFVGRESILRRIDEGRIVALTGMSGIGKTSIAIEYAGRHRACFDIRWWVRAGDPESVPGNLAKLARRLRLTTDWEADHVGVAKLQRYLGEHDRWLLVFDDVPRPEAVEKYLPPGAGKVLITSRDPEWRGIASSTVEVPVLDRLESVAVLRSWTAEIAMRDADRVAEEVGDLPPVLDVAGSVLAHNELTPAGFCDLLDRRTAEVLDHDPDGGRYPTATATWGIAFDKLAEADPAAMDLLTVLAWFGGEPIPLSLFDRLSDRLDLVPPSLRTVATNVVDLRRCVDVLRRHGMVVRGRDKGTVLLHRVPAGLLQARTDDPAFWQVAVIRLLRASLPFDMWDNPGRWEQWRQLLSHVRAATDERRATLRAAEDLVWLLDRMATYLQTTGNPLGALPIFRRAVHLCHTHLGSMHHQTLMCANNLANDLRELGCHEESLELIRETLERRRLLLGDENIDTFKSWKNLARSLFALGRYAEARDIDERTLTRRRHVLGYDDPDTLSSAGNLANDLRALGEHRQALHLHQDTLDRLRLTLGEDHPRTLTCANDLAGDFSAAGDHRQAHALYEDTLARRTRVLGADHPHTLTSAHDLAVNLLVVDAPERARDQLADTLTRRRVVLGADHPHTLATEHALAELSADPA
jgi:tetratricopeptide (TPR) repeat protein